MWQHLRGVLIYIFIPGAICGVGVQECYVCRADGEPYQELETQFPNQDLPLCGTKPPEKKICPSGSKGCLTIYDGQRVTKSCSDLFVNDCRQANNVQYCYCRGTLCNKEEKVITMTPETDDEDLSEGSGEGSTTTVTTQATKATTVTTTTITAKAQPASAGSNPNAAGSLFLLLIFSLQLL